MYRIFSKHNAPVMVLALLFLLGLMPPLMPAEAASLAWASVVVEEAVNAEGISNGSIEDGIHVGLELFPGDDEDMVFSESDDWVGDGLISVYNLPEGLTCRVEPVDGTNVMIYFDGNAVAHQAADSVDDVRIRFNSAAFNPVPGGMENSTRSDISIVFVDDTEEEPAGDYDGTMNWSAAAFTEAAADDGTIGNVIDIELDPEAAGFQGFEQSEDMLADGMVTVNNLPEGLNCFVAPSSHTHCTITLTGAAENHAVADSIDNLEIVFLDAAFTNGDASRVEDSARNDLAIDFIAGEQPPVEGADIVATFTVGETSYFVNGVQNHMDVAPFAESNRAFVPVRYLAYCMGMNEDNVSWDSGTQTASITENGFTVMLQIGNPSMNVDGDPQLMDVAPIAQDNRIFLPARFVVEAFGGEVAWDADTQTVTVTRDL